MFPISFQFRLNIRILAKKTLFAMPTMSEPVNEACRSDRPSCSKTSNMQLRNSCTFSATFNRRSTLFNVASQYFFFFLSATLNRLFFHTFFLSLFRQCLSLSLSFSLLAYLLKGIHLSHTNFNSL